MIKENSGIRKTDVINRRMFIIGAAKIVIFAGIIARLFSLQINENKKYLTLSDKNRIREWKLPPVRGEFHDFFGNVIAGNFEAYQLHIIPEQVEDFRSLLIRLRDILKFDNKTLSKIFAKKGIHIICDKPLALSSEEAIDLKKIVKSKKIIFALTYNYTGYPMVKEAKSLIENGKIGKIRKVSVEYPQGWLTTNLENTDNFEWDLVPKLD